MTSSTILDRTALYSFTKYDGVPMCHVLLYYANSSEPKKVTGAVELMFWGG